MTATRAATRDESGIALLIVLLSITLLTIVVVEFTDTAADRDAPRAERPERAAGDLPRTLGRERRRGHGRHRRPHQSPGATTPPTIWARPYPAPADRRRHGRVPRARRGALPEPQRPVQHGRDPPERSRRRLPAPLRDHRRSTSGPASRSSIGSTPITNPGRHAPPAPSSRFYLGMSRRCCAERPLLTLRELLLVRGVTPSCWRGSRSS